MSAYTSQQPLSAHTRQPRSARTMTADSMPALPTLDLPHSTTALDGSQGSNRARGGVRQIAADTDIAALKLWLAEYQGSPHTLRSYRKEAVRLLSWAHQGLGKALSSLNREDLLAYETFLAQPSAEWLDPRLPRRGAGRRLFARALTPRSVRQAMGILSGMFGYLVAAGYLAGNPLALRRRVGATSTPRRASVERYLDHTLWQAVLQSIEDLPRHTQRAQQHYERARWLFRLLYGAALRVSEAAHAQTRHLEQRRGRWWLYVVGKGDVAGHVPISDELMADLARYRTFYGLPALPAQPESTPLVLSITGRTDQFLTPTALYLIVKEILRRAADARAATDPAGAAVLFRASTHWLRHTAATHQADAGTDIRFIQKNLRHASIETTAIYLHAEDEERHKQTVRSTQT